MYNAYDQASLPEPQETGKGGKGGEYAVTNAEFVTAVFPKVPDSAFIATASKPGDPSAGGWPARRSDKSLEWIDRSRNNYIGCSSFYPAKDGSLKARKDNFAACHFLMLDDVGTKIPSERFDGFEFSWLIETSPGNHQAGIIFLEPLSNGDEAARLLNSLIEAGLCDPGSTGPLSRWARLPNGINGKPQHACQDGRPFQCRLVEWRPETRYTPQELLAHFRLGLPAAGKPKPATRPGVSEVSRLKRANNNFEILTTQASENPVLSALKGRGLYKTPLGSGKHDVTCPWVEEHTGSSDTGAAYFEPSTNYPRGGFCCQHSHREKYKIAQLLEFLEIQSSAARNKPIIRVVAGAMDTVIDAAEFILAQEGQYFQSGGHIVTVSVDASTGDPSIKPSTNSSLTRELSGAVTWEKLDQRSEDWISMDPPSRHIAVLCDSQKYSHLKPLDGLARQPYFRNSDGQLITEPGYDSLDHRFGVFDPRNFVIPEPTMAAAQAAFKLLNGLLEEFHFVDLRDQAAAMAAIFTAVVRPTLPLAPAFHVRAPVFGSGKSYLCELISTFAGSGFSRKVAYPPSQEEATKAMLALLLESPAVIEFDDMDSDWIPHGIICSMLTSETVSGRLLGQNKTATVGTRTLILGSGNNVGPVRDLLRRVVTVNLDPRCEAPTTMSYLGSPVQRVRRDRGRYVAAVLTILLAWRLAGCPKAQSRQIGSYSEWSDYCRFPIMWLGHPDPASSLVDQVHNDPDTLPLASLMSIWHENLGSVPVTVRRVVAVASDRPDLREAILEFPVDDRGEINRNKLGHFLKRHVGRTLRGLKFERCTADGRTAWKVVSVGKV